MTLASAIPEMTTGVEIENVSFDPDHSHFGGRLASLIVLFVYLYATFYDSSFSRSRDIIGVSGV